MQHLEIDLPDRLAQALDSYLQDQDSSTITAVQTALEEFLSERGYLPITKKVLRITPAQIGSGYTDTSIQHDALELDVEAHT